MTDIAVAAALATERKSLPTARLAQSAERKALNLVVVGSSPMVGAFASHGWDAQRRQHFSSAQHAG